MPQVHNIGSHMFTHTMRYPSRKFPLMERGTTQEIDWPYRTGVSVVARLPWTTRALVIGRWTGQRPEEDALSAAIGARRIDHVG